MTATSPAERVDGLPAVPRPAGVVDLGAYRGRAGAFRAPVPPPPRAEEAGDLDHGAPAVVALSPLDPAPEDAVPAAVEVRAIRRLPLRSVARMAFGASLCGVAVVVGAGVLVWLVGHALGVIANVESLAEDLGWAEFRFDGPAMLRSAAIGGGIVVVSATVLATVTAEVFNVLSRITGGLQAEVGPPRPSRRERRRARRSARSSS